MKKFVFTGITIMLLTACSQNKTAETVVQLPADEIAVFTSTDKKLQGAYDWAQKMALSYSHDGTDPVGYWYEAALPGREAFCMRDVSHQSVGAQVLGLEKHNLNMFTRFVENISESKDWCTYWEINRYNLPAPADYLNDQEFWYNLNANFDVIYACLKMYEWTGNETYLKDPLFTNFYEKSFNEYVHRWMLEPDKIMNRPLYMNSPENFDPTNNFHTCRGLASYVENFRTLTVGADLITTIYAGYKAYAEMERINGNEAAAKKSDEAAMKYHELLETKWWDEKDLSYHNFWTIDKEFHKGEGSSFILWFEATEYPERIRAVVKELLAGKWNVENLSHFPVILYRLGYLKEAYQKLTELPAMNRSEYPEVSYGVVEGVAGGVMGIKPSASNGRIATTSRLIGDTDTAELKNVPVFDGYITVNHTGRSESKLMNNTGEKIIWRATFMGEHAQVQVGEQVLEATVVNDVLGNPSSYVDVEVSDGELVIAKL